MENKWFVALWFGLAVCLCVMQLNIAIASRSTEYKIVAARLESETPERIEILLNQYASEGWEFINIYSNMAIFKR